MKNDNTTPQQPDKFTDVRPGDWKFFNTKEELEQYVREQHPDRRMVWVNEETETKEDK